MLKSMTGFGKASNSFKTKKASVEIRSLNSKSMDLSARVHGIYKELEPQIRKMIGAELGRGKVDLSISVENTEDAAATSINVELAKKYYTQLNELNAELGANTEDYLSLMLRMPDIYKAEKEELAEDESDWMIGLVKQACDDINRFREREGNELKAEFDERISAIRSLLSDVEKYESERVETVRDRIKKGLEDIEGGHDENRLEQEMIYYIEKFDVSEEKMRLGNHLDYFAETMALDQSGKKLGFIAQEIGREINTLGSKSNHAEMQKVVIDMKDNLEKIKEQILNTL
jgi:uncharacterized protein (TIGR00255 family)